MASLPNQLIVGVVIFVLGFVIAAIGVRGRRRDDHRWCRKCRYDLSGIADQPQRCPECGANLARKRAVRSGRRSKRPVLILAGSALLGLGVVGGGTVGWGHLRGFDWYTIMPVWWLDRTARNGVTPNAIAAQQEIVRRMEDADLSKGQIADLVESALTLQADSSVAWSGYWGVLVEMAWFDEAVDDSTLDRYLEGALAGGATIRVSPRARAGGLIGFEVTLPGPRGAVMSLFESHFWFDSILLDEESASIETVSGGTWPLASGIRPPMRGVPVIGGQAIAPEAAGGSVMTVWCTLACTASEMYAKAEGQPETFNSVGRLYRDEWIRGRRLRNGSERIMVPDLPILYARSFSFSVPIEILDADAEVIERRADEGLREWIGNAISVYSPTLQLNNPNSAQFHCTLNITDAPADVAFDASLRIGDEVLPLRNGLVTPKGESVRSRTGVELRTFPRGVTTVDIILRPNPRSIEGNARVTHIWDGEIVLEKIVVERKY